MENNKAWPRECLHCKEKVQFNGKDREWNGFGPCEKKRGKHEVAAVTYYHAGARDLQDGRSRRAFAPTVILVPVYERIVDGARIVSRGLSVQFFDGKCETTDPEAQFYLEEKRDVAWGEGGAQMWREIYLTPEQQNAIAKAELAETQRQIKESNELLAQMKSKKGVPAPANA